MKERIDFSIVWQEFKKSFKIFYPYFLIFYILAIFIGLWSDSWKTFFYWPGFHISIIFFTIIYLYFILFNKKLAFKFNLKILWKKIANLSRATLIKIIIIAIVLIFSLYQQIDVLNFLILLFGLVSVLMPVDNRWAAGAALVFLAACPVFLIVKQDSLAEKSAIFAYYLLVISVLTMVHESFYSKDS